MDEQPNILLILTDQHRLSAVGCYGDTPCRTPHIDRLAQEGVRFAQAYTTCPVCSPARASLITGLYPHRNGITTNIHEIGCSVQELADTPSLLPHRLRAAGYQLGYTGKWHLGSDATRNPTFDAPSTPCLPRHLGFQGQSFPGHGDGGHRYPEYQDYLAAHGWQHALQPWAEPYADAHRAGELVGPVESSVAYFLAEHTLSLLENFRHREEPFFIWHNFWGPHSPQYAARPYVEMYRDVEIPPWPNYEWPARTIPGPHQMKIHPRHETLTWHNWATTIRYYYALTTMIDEQIGRIIRYLEQTKLLEKTVVIFAADHGETLGSHGGLTDKGWHHFEETHRIPLIIRLPDGRWRGAVYSELVSLVDLYPTILELAQAPASDHTSHGLSLLPLLEEDGPWREAVVTEFGGLGGHAFTQRTLRCGDLKYGYNAVCEDELYDLDRDPHETLNLIDHPHYRAALADLQAQLAAWMESTQDQALGLYRKTRMPAQTA